jgi:outer membrane receptor for ferrienterochelin and colicins
VKILIADDDDVPRRLIQRTLRWPHLGKSGRLILVAGFVACLSSAWTLNAQSQSDPDAMSLSIEELTHAKVFSASKHLEDSRQAPSSVSTITAEDIRRYGWRTLGDALSSLRGFYTSYDRDYTYLGVRGILRPGDYNSRVLLLVNGHRMNDNVFDDAFIGTEFALDLDLIDHIEIVRGPSSSLFGTNAVFGVINVITRHRASDNAVELSGDTASFLGRTGRLTANFQKGQLSGLFSGSLYRSAGQARLFFPEFATPATNNGWAVDVDGDRSGQAFGDLQYGNFRIHGLFSTRTKIIPTGSFDANFNDPANRSVDSRAYVELGYHRAVSLGDINIRGYYDWYGFLGVAAFGGLTPPNRIVGQTLGGAHWVGTEASLDRQIGRHRIIVGADYEHSIRILQENLWVGQPPYFADRRQPSRAAVYGEGELNLLPKLSIRLGSRLDWFSLYGISLSPRIAFVYSPNSRTAVKYIYGRAFRAPNVYENYYSDGIVVEAPRKLLKPESMGSNEVILEHGLNPWLQVTVDGSYNHLQDLIDQVPDPSTGLSHFVNVGRDRGRTIEMELEAKRASGLAARASYSLSDASDSILQRPLDNSPSQMAKINGTIPLSHLFFGALESRYISGQQTYHGTRVQPALLTNATLSSGPALRDWEFSASCYNAFNNARFDPAGPNLPEPDIRQDGRTYLFKLSRRLSFEHATK